MAISIDQSTTTCHLLPACIGTVLKNNREIIERDESDTTTNKYMTVAFLAWYRFTLVYWTHTSYSYSDAGMQVSSTCEYNANTHIYLGEVICWLNHIYILQSTIRNSKLQSESRCDLRFGSFMRNSTDNVPHKVFESLWTENS